MNGPEPFVHPTAVVHPRAQLDAGVWIGPYCQVGEKAVLGRNTKLESNVFITGSTAIGPDCHFSPFSVIGTEPQDVSYGGEETRLQIGAQNVFREFVTVHRGSSKGGGLTEIGQGNYFMAYCHVAHDCRVGNETVFINGATLGGHVTVGDYVMISGLSAAHQFCRIGRYAFIGGYSVVTQDVVPFSKMVGSRPLRLLGLNLVGLRRRGFSKERIQALKHMFKLLFYSDLNTSQALERIEAEVAASPDREELLSFIRASKRGIARKLADQWDAESE